MVELIGSLHANNVRRRAKALGVQRRFRIGSAHSFHGNRFFKHGAGESDIRDGGERAGDRGFWRNLKRDIRFLTAEEIGHILTGEEINRLVALYLAVIVAADNLLGADGHAKRTLVIESDADGRLRLIQTIFGEVVRSGVNTLERAECAAMIEQFVEPFDVDQPRGDIVHYISAILRGDLVGSRGIRDLHRSDVGGLFFKKHDNRARIGSGIERKQQIGRAQ
ncbi:hypothetical protein SDC9_83685 [bioreactor metagenome]|uniref:Uncharacterized protein n=1 Tax=bioreactor metagenome TaxID=1076179 RepID=A0A644Z8V7_9ZZZZ